MSETVQSNKSVSCTSGDISCVSAVCLLCSIVKRDGQGKFWLGTAWATGGDNEPRCLTYFATYREETSQEVIIAEMLFAGILAKQQLLLAVLDNFT